MDNKSELDSKFIISEKISTKLSDIQQAYCFERMVSKSEQVKSSNVLYELVLTDFEFQFIESSWNEIIQHYDILRSIVSNEGVQKYGDYVGRYEIELRYVKDADDDNLFYTNLRQQLLSRKFPLNQWPHFCVNAVSTPSGKIKLFLLFDMLMADVNSLQLIVKRYMKLLSGILLPEKVTRIKYIEYRSHIDEKVDKEYIESAKKYWNEKFKGIPPAPEIYTTGSLQIVYSNNKELKNIFENWGLIKEKSARYGLSPSIVLLTLYSQVLFQGNNQRPFTIVIVDFDSPTQFVDQSEMVGDFTSLAWLTIKSCEGSFLKLANDIKQQLDNDRKHSLYSGLNELRRIIFKNKGNDGNIGQYPFVFTNVLDPIIKQTNKNIDFQHLTTSTPGVSMDCIAYEVEEKLHLQWDIKDNLVENPFVNSLFEYFNEYLRLLSLYDKLWRENFSNTLNAVELDGSNSMEQSKTIDQESSLSGIRKNYHAPKTIHELFDASVKDNIQATAIEFDNQRIDYSSFDRWSKNLAVKIQRMGIEKDTIIAVMLDRSIEMVVALMGSLRAGGAYLPIDISHPKDRVSYILKDSNAKYLISTSEWINDLNLDDTDVNVINIEDVDANAKLDYLDVEKVSTSSDLAYVLYTSGSTGNPKGCMLEHNSIVNRLLWMADEYQIDKTDRILQKTPYTFDVSVWEIFLPLITGATLVLAKPKGHHDVRYLSNIIIESNITICHFVPSMFAHFLRDERSAMCKSLTRVITSGEALPYSMVETFLNLFDADLHNLYGPTEAAIDVTYWHCKKNDQRKVLIGKPVSNTQVYVLDDDLNPVLRGDEGELYVGGVQVGRGYLNRPDLNKKSFLVDNLTGEYSGRLYKTGDKVRMLDDGNIEYVGRFDNQIKLRGLRIEIGEIENTILQHPTIHEAVVVVQDLETDDPKLVSYICSENEKFELKQLRSFLRNKLPDYMLPNALYVLPELPVTSHGKLDRKKLPWSNNLISEVSINTLRNQIEVKLEDYFKESLSIDETIESDSDLFNLGATSFTIVQLVRWLNAEYNLEVPVEVLLETPTIKDIVSYVEKAIVHEKEIVEDANVNETKLAKKSEYPKIYEFLNDFITTQCNLERIEPDDDIFDLGVTSFTLVQLVQRIQNDYGFEVPVEAFLEKPHVSEIADYLQSKFLELPQDNVESECVDSEKHNDLLAKVSNSLLSFVNDDLGVGIAGENDDLFDLGITSFTLVQIAAMISEKYEVEIPVELFLDTPRIAAITQLILERTSISLAIPETEDNNLSKKVDEYTHKKKKTIFLRKFALDSDRYSAISSREIKAGNATNSTALSKLLSSLASYTVDGNLKYLYPSGGGKNAIQAYVTINQGGVQGIDAGIYYYNPSDHSLYFINKIEHLDFLVFNPVHRKINDHAAFNIHLIVQMDAIVPFYAGFSQTLVELDTGYITSLLMKQQKKCNLEILPVVDIDFRGLADAFMLDSGHHHMLSLIVGESLPEKFKHVLTPMLSGELHKHHAFNNKLRSIEDIEEIDRHPTFTSYTKEQLGEIAKEERHIRKFINQNASVKLEFYPADDHDYLLRSCQRLYKQEPVNQHSLEKLLSLVASQAGHNLYWSAIDYAVDIYVFCKEGGVDGLVEGIYKYDRDNHSLLLISDEIDGLDEAVISSHVPFNRTHYKLSSFNLFMILDVERVVTKYGNYGIQLAYYEAGQIGQLLMDYQSEIDLGVCPIGAMQFHKIRDYFNISDKEILLHSMFGGGVDYSESISNPIFTNSNENTFVEKTNINKGELAIIGLSGKYPGSGTPEELWDLVSKAETAIEKVPQWRWSHSDTEDWGAFIHDVEYFDSLFFKISPAEAKLIDPQERQFLETVWHCLENAGYTKKTLSESAPKVGVFVGCMWNDYNSVAQQNNELEQYAVSFHSSIANRISHFFDLSGPSIAVDTSCASALSALHLARQSIACGDCDAAIVGGINLCLHPYHHNVLKQMGLLSSNKDSASFSANGSGWVVGEGVGAILVRPLEQAKACNDIIQGVVKATEVRHTGETSGYGVPDVKKMVKSIKNILTDADLKPEDIHYIESAATGSPIADAAEVNALKEAIRSDNPDFKCPIGSIKPNIGHLESASFMSQITKVIQQFKNDQIAPTVVTGDINPLINLSRSNLYINQELRSTGPEKNTRALINAVGALGTIGHVIVEQYDTQNISEQEMKNADHIIPLSANSKTQLVEYSKKLKSYLIDKSKHIRLCDIAYSLQIGRVELTNRVIFIAQDVDELIMQLQHFITNDFTDQIHYGEVLQKEHKTLHEYDSPKIVCKQWVMGYGINWSNLHSGGERRIELPGYHFDKVRHWQNYNERGSSSEINTSNEYSVKPEIIENTVDAELKEKSVHYFVNLFSKVSELHVASINPKKELINYGFNSLLVTKMNLELSKHFSKVSKAILYECKTIDDLSKHFISHFNSELSELLGVNSKQIKKPAHSETTYPDSQIYVNNNKSNILEKNNEHEIEIAIVGLDGRFPKADNIAEFWDNLSQGKDCIEEIPLDRWNHKKYKQKYKWGGFVSDYDKFDPLFFGISPAEAELMDPQERLFLQVAWSTFENAGYKRNILNDGDNIGVFVGVMYGEYQLYGAESTQNGYPVSLNSIYGSIANRVSYFMNFDGPSMAIDTLCSSSLTALHLAKQSILAGDCKSALVGGVNLSVHPNKYLLHDRMNMPSSDGRCHSFGEGGDGFVPGEGIGAIYIKRKIDAVNDRDHIYALIKGTSINHDSKTNGYTVPNPIKQGELVKQALSNSGVDPRSISYIETHGTGTALGDPIEISGLCKAFDEIQDKQFCSIGSVKSNIGHLESAAGIASIAKVLLQLQHKQLVPSLHSKDLNPNIDFPSTPFYVQQSISAWDRPVIQSNGESVEFPRRAGISSFGAGGANAHVIIEEYESDEISSSIYLPFIFLLSARNSEGLKKYLRIWRDYVEDLEKQSTSSESLSTSVLNALYTLQTSRESMKVRVAFIAPDYQTFIQTLRSLSEGSTATDCKVLQGEVGNDLSETNTWFDDDDTEDILDLLVRRKRYEKLLTIWIMGTEINWTSIYTGQLPKKQSIPTYPFAKKRYWVEKQNASNQLFAPRVMLHPLIEKNSSNLANVSFSKNWTREHQWVEVDSHRNDYSITPGALLEMLIASMKLAYEELESGYLENISLGTPLFDTDSEVELNCYIYGDADGLVSNATIESIENNVHSQGLLGATLRKSELPTNDFLKTNTAEHYKKADTISRYRKLINVSKEDVADSVYMIHPQLWNKVIKTVQNHFEQVRGIAGVAHYIHKVEVQSNHDLISSFDVRENPSAYYSDVGDSCFDIFFLNEQNKPVLRVEGICVKAMKSRNTRITDDLLGFVMQDRTQESLPENTTKQDISGLTLVFSESNAFLKKLQSNKNLATENFIKVRSQKDFKKIDSRQYALDTSVKVQFDQLLSQVNVGQLSNVIIHMNENDKSVHADDFMKIATLMFYVCQSLIKTNKDVNLLYLIECSSVNWSIYSAGSSFLRSLSKESIRISSKTVVIESGEKGKKPNQTGIGKIVSDEVCSFNKGFEEVIYNEQGVRYLTEYKDLELEENSFHFKNAGTYLVVGGLQGVGYLIARYLDSQEKIKLVLVGRRELTDELTAKLDTLKVNAISIEYIQADVTIESDIKNLHQHIKCAYGNLNGIIHCGGVLSDSLLSNKNEEDYRKVFSPKVKGTLLLDEYFKDEPLDFMVYFSSLIAVMGNAGQSDYAYANAFMDKYAAKRNQLVRSGARSGKTISINWPYWQDGGMRVNSTYLDIMNDEIGLIPLRTSQGIKAFSQILASDKEVVSVISGDINKFANKHFMIDISLYSKTKKAKYRHPVCIPIGEAEIEADMKFSEVNKSISDREILINWLFDTISQVSKVDKEDLNLDEEFSNIGMDSILAMEVIEKISKEYSIRLYPREIEEYNTVIKLSAYLGNELSERGFSVSKEAKEVTELTKEESTRSDTIESYLFQMVADVIKLDRESIAGSDIFSSFGMDSILSMQLIEKIQIQFSIRIYPRELEEYNSISKLSVYLERELQEKKQNSSNLENAQNQNRKNSSDLNKPEKKSEDFLIRKKNTTDENNEKRLVFVLSTPRAGSTLLRVMLEGHNDIFSPPELHLLEYDNMKIWFDELKSKDQNYLKEGLIKTIVTLEKSSIDDARGIVDDFVEKSVPTSHVYEYLQKSVTGRYIVDKSPTYAFNIETLKKAEEVTREPLYIHLIRHPLSMMSSFVENRFDKLFMMEGDSWKTAEDLWCKMNANIEACLRDIPQERSITLKYEDLVSKPLEMVDGLCDWLNIPSETQMLNPYHGDRMRGGLHESSIPVGDPNFNTHNTIDSNLAKVWEKHLSRVDSLDNKTLLLAEKYGYPLSSEKHNNVDELSNIGENVDA